MKGAFKGILIIAIILIASISGYLAYITFFTPGNGGNTNGGNHAPNIANLPDIALNEDTQKLNVINLTLYANDTDGDPITYAIKSNTNAAKCNVSIDSKNLIDIIPCANWYGVVDVMIEVSDGILKANDTFLVTVNSVNDLPIITQKTPSSNTASLNETQSMTFSLAVSDLENNPISYNWSVDGTRVGGNQSSYTYKAWYASSGNRKIRVNVSDGFDMVNLTWTVKVNDTGPIFIYVNSSLFNSISTELKQYKQDIINQGFRITMFNWSNTDPASLRNNLSYYYTSQQLMGAMLIGQMPYRLASYYEGPPYNKWYDYCFDLYLMDLNATWNDLIVNGKVDHAAGEWTGDQKPEIFVARIDPSSLVGRDQANAYQKYFQRNHDYRTGTLKRPHSGLLYIDDTWSGLTGWDTNFTAYDNKTICKVNSWTNKTDYLNRLTQFYEWVHPLIHSDPQNHYLDHPSKPPGDPTETINTAEILATYTRALFFNLYCCYACNYTDLNNLGDQYLFSNNSLTVIGSSRTGGMDLYQPFYDELKKGIIIGSAFKTWFYNPEIDQFNKRNVVSGTLILGDPMLSIL